MRLHTRNTCCCCCCCYCCCCFCCSLQVVAHFIYSGRLNALCSTALTVEKTYLHHLHPLTYFLSHFVCHHSSLLAIDLQHWDWFIGLETKRAAVQRAKMYAARALLGQDRAPQRSVRTPSLCLCLLHSAPPHCALDQHHCCSE